MNKNIIKACLNPGIDIENAIKREIVKEVIDKYFSYDKVIYDGRVISLYDLDKIMNEKMDYINELCNFNNYVLKSDIISRKFGFVLHGNWLEFNIADNGMLNINLYHPILIRGIIFSCFLENDNISYKIRYCSLKHSDSMEELLMHITKNTFYDNEDEVVAKDFIENFIKDNEDILLEILNVIEDIYKENSVIRQVIGVEGIKGELLFNLYSRTYSLNINFLDIKGGVIYNLENLELNDYISNNRDELLKRVSVNIDCLNPFYRNEIDKYYNSINSIDYKCYRRKK